MNIEFDLQVVDIAVDKQEDKGLYFCFYLLSVSTGKGPRSLFSFVYNRNKPNKRKFALDLFWFKVLDYKL